MLAHAEVLQDPATGLFAHGSHAGRPSGASGAGPTPGARWRSVELLELAAAPDSRGEAGRAVRERLARQLRALAASSRSTACGACWSTTSRRTAGILETSAAAGIGAAMLRAAAVVPDLPSGGGRAGWRAVRGALAYVDPDGALTRTSAGTVLQLVPFGYCVIRDDRPQPWGQGLALHAVAAALEHLR